jgi:hypothetical protein
MLKDLYAQIATQTTLAYSKLEMVRMGRALLKDSYDSDPLLVFP